jgi:hypothetical protein
VKISAETERSSGGARRVLQVEESVSLEERRVVLVAVELNCEREVRL